MGTPNGVATLRSDVARLTASQSPYGNEIPFSADSNNSLVDYMKKLFTLPYLGRNWTAVAGSPACYDALYANGIWVACSNGSGLYWSDDGKIWTQSESVTTGVFVQVYFASGVWVALSISGLFWSNDGKSWTQAEDATENLMTDMYNYIAYGNNLWVVTSQNNGLYWSNDGKTWRRATSTPSESFTGCHYGNGVWLACSGTNKGIYRSTDGKTWERTTQSGSSLTGKFYRVYNLNDTWVATSADNAGVIASFNGGSTWYTTSIQTGAFKEIYYANGVWLAGNYNPQSPSSNKLYISSDVNSWSEVSITVSSVIQSITFINGTFFVTAGAIFTSMDGKHWVKVNPTLSPYTINYANGILVRSSNSSGAGLAWSSIDNLEGFPLLDS